VLLAVASWRHSGDPLASQIPILNFEQRTLFLRKNSYFNLPPANCFDRILLAQQRLYPRPRPRPRPRPLSCPRYQAFYRRQLDSSGLLWPTLAANTCPSSRTMRPTPSTVSSRQCSTSTRRLTAVRSMCTQKTTTNVNTKRRNADVRCDKLQRLLKTHGLPRLLKMRTRNGTRRRRLLRPHHHHHRQRSSRKQLIASVLLKCVSSYCV
jgi:hypothetical protein